MRKIKLLVAIFLLFYVGCTKDDFDQSQHGKALAIIDDVTIYEEDLGDRTLDQAIKIELIYQEALRRGFDEDKRVQKQIRDLIVSTFTTDLYTANWNINIGDDEIGNYYNEHKNQFLKIKVAEIVLYDEEIAEEAHKKALSGQDFTKLVDKYADPRTKKRGGIAHVNPIYKDGLFINKEIGDIVLVYEGAGRYRLMNLLEKEYLPFDLVKKGIESRITMEKQAEVIEDFVDKLKKERKVEILSQSLVKKRGGEYTN